MPTENEQKIVLQLDSPEDEFLIQSSRVLHIHQVYLSKSTPVIRIRKTRIENSEKYVFCFKHRVKNRIVEIEQEIDARDFDDLAHSFVLHLRKIRYIIEHDDGMWEVDFFKDRKGKNYFVMAEHEMPELQLKPKSIPAIIADCMLHKVEPFDGNYGSNRLCDIQHATHILETLTNEEKE